MTFYIENHEDVRKKVLEKINEFTKIVGYKIDIYNHVSVHTMNYLKEKSRKHFNLLSPQKNIMLINKPKQ